MLDKKALREKLLKTSVLEFTAPIEESKIYGKKWIADTGVPFVNLALSGHMLSGGLTQGITVIAGESKHFKTGFALKLASSFQKRFEEGIVVMYDSEFGSPPSYLKGHGIDLERFIHSPITNIEELQFDMVAQLENLNKGDRVFFMLDSLGNLASKKESEDMKNQKATVDMSRNRALKSFFRTITPILAIKEISLVIISHVYDTMDFISTKVVSGGKGQQYSADNIWIVNRRQAKDGTELEGFDFIITVDKSRFVKEKSKFPISVRWKKGIDRYSGIVDHAVEFGFVKRLTAQKYEYEGVTYSKKELEANKDDVLEKILNTPEFSEKVEQKFIIPDVLDQLKRERNESQE